MLISRDGAYKEMFKKRTTMRTRNANLFGAAFAKRIRNGYISRKSVATGHGLGGLFKGLFRIAAPIIKRTLVPIGKRALKAVSKKALKAGARAVKDIVEDKVSVKDALKNRAAEVIDPRNYTINTGTRKRTTNRSNATSQKKAKRSNKKIDAPYLKNR